MDHLHEILEFDDLYSRLHDVGCVIEFAVLRHDNAKHLNVYAHRNAAISALHVFAKRVDAYFDALLKRPEYSNRTRSEFFGVTTNAALIGEGSPVPLADFLGPFCDIEKRRLLMRGPINRDQILLYWCGEKEIPKNAVDQPMRTSGDGGFAGAYLDPPYSLSGSKEKINALFFEVVDRLFGGFACPVEIYKWSPDCSNYFDAGKEWWGCYFWTLSTAGSDRIVAIAASSTD